MAPACVISWHGPLCVISKSISNSNMQIVFQCLHLYTSVEYYIHGPYITLISQLLLQRYNLCTQDCSIMCIIYISFREASERLNACTERCLAAKSVIISSLSKASYRTMSCHIRAGGTYTLSRQRPNIIIYITEVGIFIITQPDHRGSYVMGRGRGSSYPVTPVSIVIWTSSSYLQQLIRD